MRQLDASIVTPTFPALQREFHTPLARPTAHRLRADVWLGMTIVQCRNDRRSPDIRVVCRRCQDCRMAIELAVIGVPTSAGAHHAGQDRTPGELRKRGFVEKLHADGIWVIDVGDVAGEVWSPAEPDSIARNVAAVVRVVSLSPIAWNASAALDGCRSSWAGTAR